MHTAHLVVFALAAIVFAGIGFLLWMLLHLFLEGRSRRRHPEQTAAHDRSRH